MQGPPTTSNSQQLLNLSGLGAALELATNSSSLLSIMGERDINSNSSLNTTTTVNIMGEVEAIPSSPHLTITSLVLTLLLRGLNTRRFSLNNSNSQWQWSSSLHNTHNLSHSNSSIISSRCTYSLNSSSNIHIT